MTRDFEIEVDDAKSMNAVEDFLLNAKVRLNDEYLDAFGFCDKVDNKTIFASFIYSLESRNISLEYENKVLPLNDLIDFVAIKNGKHNQKGWVYTNSSKVKNENSIQLWDLQKFICET